MDFQSIDQKKGIVDAKRPLPSAAVKTLRERLLVEWTFHSNAIEGNTLTLSETRVILEGITIGGKSLREHFEVINHVEAIELVEELVNRKVEISEFTWKQLHQLILKNIRDREAGVYRTINVFLQGSTHTPPMNSLVPGLMKDLLDWYHHENLLHPIEKAASFHHKFVYIHPFVDGNGRTARLLMNLILTQHGYPPAVIRQQDRVPYYEALRYADEKGDLQPLTLLIAQAVERMLDDYIWVLGE